MGNLTVLGGILRFVFFYGLPVILVLIIFFNRTRKKRVILLSILLALALVNLFVFYQSNENNRIEAVKRFSGFYKLDKLDGQECENCKLDLHSDYTFDIFVDNKITGTGKWHLDIDYEEVGTYLVIEGGPSGVASIDEIKREVAFLNRSTK